MITSLPAISEHDPYRLQPVPNIHLSRLNSLVNGVATAIFILCPPLYLLERAADWITTQVIEYAFLPGIATLKAFRKEFHKPIAGVAHRGIPLTDDEMREQYPEYCNPITLAPKERRIEIKTSDGVTLRGFEMLNDKMKPIHQQKWVITFIGNSGGFIKPDMSNSVFYTLGYKVNYLNVNYRGVYESKGFPRSAEDLYRDGSAMVATLLDRGVAAKNILVYGKSLGGGIATAVTAEYHKKGQMIACINERSFSSIAWTVIGYIPKLLDMAKKFLSESSTHELIIIGFKAIAALIMIAVAFPFLVLMSPFLIYKLNQLNINATAAIPYIDPTRFRVIYHKNDNVISHPIASLAATLQSKREYEGRITEITQDLGEEYGSNHNDDLMFTDEGIQFFKSATKELLFNRSILRTSSKRK